MPLEDKKEILLEYLFFINYKEYIHASTEYYIHNNKSFFEQLKEIKINFKTIFNDKIFKIIFHMYIYLIIQMKTILFKLLENNNNEFIEIKEINESYYILFQLFILLLKLYTENKYSLKHLFLFMDILIFYIDKNDIINDI